MPFVDWKDYGGHDKKLETRVKWFDTIPFMKNKVAPAIEEHVRQGGQEPSLIAFRIIGKDRATIFAESHDKPISKFRQELEVWVQLCLTKKFGESCIETERRADGHTVFYNLDAANWADLVGWVTTTSHTRLKSAEA